MKTIVSITPIAVERDSRTFKQAASMAAFGYRSIVVEAEPSRSLAGALPFELVTIGGRPAPAPASEAPAAAPAPAGASRMPAPVRAVGQLLDEVRQYAARCRATAAALPPADLYYLHSPLYFPAIWWRSRRTPFVYDAHDLYWEVRRDGRDLTVAVRGIWAVGMLLSACALPARAAASPSATASRAMRRTASDGISSWSATPTTCAWTTAA